MELYVKTDRVWASKYREGLEDGFTIVPVSNDFEITKEYEGRTDCMLVPYIEVPGFCRTLIHGNEYIVQEEGSACKYVMNEKEFHKKFRKVEK